MGRWVELGPVIRELQKQGLNVVAAPIPLTSLGDDAAALKRSVARTKGPVIIVGHAYAGAVLGMAHDERVEALVYIAALAPDEGETVAQVFYRDKAHPSASQLAPDEDGFIWMPDESFAQAFAQDATSEQIALCRAVQRPIALKSIQEKVVAPSWKNKPVWYPVAEKDRMINPKTQHFMAERMKATVRSFPWTTHHCLPLRTRLSRSFMKLLERRSAEQRSCKSRECHACDLI